MKEWSDSIQMGNVALKNRIVMAALTRQRCDPKLGIPNQLLVQYYSQRAGAAFILTEATAWNKRGQGFIGAACLYNKQQMEGWKKVVEAVHKKQGLIFLQIFHAGRVTHPLKNEGLQSWAPSSLQVRQTIRDLQGKSYPLPKEMSIQDIEQTKRDFQESIKLAVEAGFDGIQLHGAHGYLIHEFLNSCSNKRKDHYGGSFENRIRFCLQLMDIALKYYSPDRLGIKLSPASRIKDMFDQNPIQTYGQLLKQFSKRNIGFVEFRESTEVNPFPNHYGITPKEQIPDVCAAFRPFFTGIIIGNDSFNPETGIEKVRANNCDMISFGKLYISNPDLAQRIINKWQVNTKWDVKTFYGAGHGEKGYIDYPCYK